MIIEKEAWINSVNFSCERDKNLLSRAYDVLMENVYPQEGYLWSPYRCITPGKIEFDGIWNWDSAFHAVGVSRWDTTLAKESIWGFFKFQKENGFLPDVIHENGIIGDYSSKPPVFAWAVETVYNRDGDRSFIEEMYPKLTANIGFWERERSAGGLFFYDASKKDCNESLTYAKWETGWDGSVRWDNGVSNYWAIDLNCYMVMSYSAMKYLAKELGKQSESHLWELKEKTLSTLINEKMWDSKNRYYGDTDRFTGEVSRVLTPANFMPLYIRIASAERAQSMAKIAADEKHFGGKMPMVSFDNPGYGSIDEGMTVCYARGSIWLHVSYFAAKGLKNYGFKVGDDIKNSVLNMCDNEKRGIFENYDAKTLKGQCCDHFSWSCVFLMEFILNF